MDAPSNGLARQNGQGATGEKLPTISPPRLMYHPMIEERFGVDRASWKALVEAIFPNAQSTESVILALSYCRARKLDPFKRNVHIVPIWDKNRGAMTDTIWPGIGELRTTAFRTGEYAGRDETAYGPDVTKEFSGSVGKGNYAKEVKISITFPEWAQVTVYRMVRDVRVGFCGPRVHWIETYSTQGKSDVPNEMWETRPRGQIDKCAEAAALRAAFPEEVGSDYIGEEAAHVVRTGGAARIEVAPVVSRTDAVAAKLGVTSRPVSENQTFVPDENAEQSVAAQDAVVGETFDRETGEVAEQPEPPDLSSHEALVEAMEQISRDRDMKPSAVGEWWAAYALSKGVKGKEAKMTPAQRSEALAAFAGAIPAT